MAAPRRPYVDDIDAGIDNVPHQDVANEHVTTEPFAAESVPHESYPHEKSTALAQAETHDDLDEKEGLHEVTTEKLANLADHLGETQNGIAPLDDVRLVMDRVETMTIEDAKKFVVEILEEHKWDYNFGTAQRNKLSALLDGPLEGQTTDEWELEIKSEAAVCKFYSPYPEVRAVTQPNDDPSIPCETIRAHLLGYAWACIAQFINSLFNSRFPQIIITSAVTQIFLYPCGKAFAFALPDVGFTIRGKRHSLNPGPWSYKEQMLATVIVNVSVTSAYCFWNIQTQTVYYKDKWLTPGYEILLLLSTQLMGLGFAGMLRRFVVYPTQTFWPSILPTLALNRALLLPDRKETIHGWKASKYKFFFITFIGMCLYYWLPGYLFTGLSTFAWMAWIAPNNFNLAVVTGSQFGMGINPLSTFDWNVLSTYFFPLYYPFFSFLQQYIGQFIGTIAVLIIYYSNVKWSAYLPPNSSGIFDNTGARYNISRVIDNGRLNQDAYQAYSPAFYSAGNLVLYGAFFAFYPLTFVFIILDQWRPISRAYKKLGAAVAAQTRRLFAGLGNSAKALGRGHVGESFKHLYGILDQNTSVYDGFDDTFTNLMRNYKEVPDWWFLMIVLVSFIFAIIVLTQFSLGTPVWTIFFVIGLNLVFLIPMTYLYAISGTTEGLNVVTELIVGYAMPGNPEALMFVKAFGYNINGQADNYISDQKMGHYAKIPPRAMYRGQVISAVITALVAYGVVNFADNDIKGICTPHQAAKFNCAAGSQVYFSSSVVWGLIGPKRIFGQIYPIMKYAFLIGFLLGLAWWVVKKYGPSFRAAVQRSLPAGVYRIIDMTIFWPISLLRDVHPSLILNGMIYLAPTNLTYSTGGLYISFIFMYYIKRYKTAWFEKYNYVLSASLTGGIAFMSIIIFFAVQYKARPLNWWGNNIVAAGVDGGSATQTALYMNLPDKGYFGPDSWF